MRNLVFICFCILFVPTVSAQNIEFSGGINRNGFYDFHDEEKFIVSNYKGGTGFSIGAGVTDFTNKIMPMRLTLRFDAYKGNIDVANVALAGSSKTLADVQKYTLGIGVYPIHFVLKRTLELSFGGELSFLLGDKVTGVKTSAYDNYPDKITSLDKNEEEICNPAYFGLSGRISYNYQLSNNLYLVPKFKLYLGITDEFKNIETSTRSVRTNIELGVIYVL